jgi:hypothetical protein
MINISNKIFYLSMVLINSIQLLETGSLNYKNEP